MAKTPKTYSEPKKCERRKKAIPIRFTKVNMTKWNGLTILIIFILYYAQS